MKSTNNVRFVGTCVGLPARDLNAFDDSACDITYRTFRKHVVGDVTEEISEWASWPGTHFSQDWHIQYFKGKWKDKPAVCMMHSSIHHIWLV